MGSEMCIRDSLGFDQTLVGCDIEQVDVELLREVVPDVFTIDRSEDGGLELVTPGGHRSELATHLNISEFLETRF